MFKRTKKLSPPPTAPNLEEILEDLETFHIEKPLPIRTRILNTPLNTNNGSSSPGSVTGNISLNESSQQEWWKVFETFLYDVEDLKRMKSDINGFKIKMESSRLEINTISKNLQNDIDESLAKTKLEIKDDDQ